MNSFFKKMIFEFKDPWRSLLEVASKKIDNYSNRVIIGKYLPNEKALIRAFSIVGIAPDSDDPESHNLDGLFLECHMVFGQKRGEEKIWLSQLRETTDNLSFLPTLSGLSFEIIRRLVQDVLGKKEFHLIGMLSAHHVIESGEVFSVLWGHPQLGEKFVEDVVKRVASQRLRQKPSSC